MADIENGGLAGGRWKAINIWPDEVIQLQRELMHHPELMERLKRHPDLIINGQLQVNWETRLAEIAVYCEVILDGDYLPEDVQRLCGILTVKLVARRKDNRGLLVIEDVKL